MAKYRDNDLVNFDFPPPNANVQLYIDEEIPTFEYSRGGYDDSLPSWVKGVVTVQMNTQTTPLPPPSNVSTPKKSNGLKVRKVTPRGKQGNTVTPSPRPPRKRGSPESFQIQDMEEAAKIMQAKFNSALERIEGLKAEVVLKDKELIQIRLERDNLLEENAKLRNLIEELEKKKLVLSYDDLKLGVFLMVS